MTVSEIKESGLLEEYVFGNPSAETISIVENWIIMHPELKGYIQELEIVAEKLATENATQAPASWKTETISKIKETKKNSMTGPDFNWIPLTVSLIIGALMGAGILSGKLNTAKSELNSLQIKYAQLSEDCSKDKILIAESENLLNYIQDKNTQTIVLRQINQGDNVTVFWNESGRKAIASIEGLQPLGEEESYQIWADVEGEMISVGLLEQEEDRFVSLEFVDNAESLNITIEPKGGSDHPTVSRLIMSAKV